MGAAGCMGSMTCMVVLARFIRNLLLNSSTCILFFLVFALAEAVVNETLVSKIQ